MSSNALELLRSRMGEAADGSSPLASSIEVSNQPTTSKTVSSGNNVSPIEVTAEMEEKLVTLHENKPRTYDEGMSLKDVAEEFSIIMEQELIRQNLSSISADAFGIFHTLGIPMKRFSLITDANTGQQFYILKGFDKSAHNKQLLVEAGRKNRRNVLSINYTRSVILQIPINASPKAESTSVVTKPLEATSLTFTSKEIEAMKFNFISKFGFLNDGDKDLLLVYYNLEHLDLSESTVSSGHF